MINYAALRRIAQRAINLGIIKPPKVKKSWSKEDQKEYNRKYYRQNRDRICADRREWRQKRGEKHREYYRRWKKLRKDKLEREHLK